MTERSAVVIAGRVVSGRPATPVGGVFVRVLLGKRLLGRGTTDRLGQFRIELPVGRRLPLRAGTRLVFAISRGAQAQPFHATKPMHLSDLPAGTLKVSVPAKQLEQAFAAPQVRLLVDDGEAESLEVGQTISLQATGLKPNAVHEVVLAVRGRQAGGKDRAVLSQTVTSDSLGRLARTTVLPQFGLWAFDSADSIAVRTALAQLGGGELAWSLAVGGGIVARGALPIAAEQARPLAFAGNRRGEAVNAIEAGRKGDELVLAVFNPPPGSLSAWLVDRRDGWSPGDPVEPARDLEGRALLFPNIQLGRNGTVRLADAARIRPGAYGIVVRAMRYGYEADDMWRLQPRDIVVGRGFAGLVVREDFERAKPVFLGCVNSFPMSGSPVTGAPYFRYRNTFAVGEDIYAALDPGIVMSGQIGRKIALNVVASKTAAQWNASTALTHIAPIGPLDIVLQGGCVNGNARLVWPAIAQTGTFDIVADFGNNDPNPANFLADGRFDTPADMIDGYFQPGFHVVEDPATLAEWLNVGAFAIDAARLADHGIGPSMIVPDENTAYFNPGGFVEIERTIPREAIVRFPADGPGASEPSQISTRQADYPLFVVVHGNGHNYLDYAFLLEHMARNGFIAVSFKIIDNVHGLARAQAFFDHVATVGALFGASMRNSVAVLGHSRGGEAVFKIARLNHDDNRGVGLAALISLAPTDQYGREALVGPAARPLFVLYGAKDGDIDCGPPYAGYNVRQSGFSLFDRFDGRDKTMVFVSNASHNGFVTHNEGVGTPPPLLAVADQRRILLAYCNAFCRLHLRGEGQWRGLFAGEWKPPGVAASGAVLAVQFRSTQRHTIDECEWPHNWQVGTAGGAVVQIGLPAAPIEAQLHPQDFQSPHDTGGLRFNWNAPASELTFAIPAGMGDVRGYSHLSVRLGKVVGAINPAGPQNLRIGLRDSAGNERRIRASAFGGVPEIAVANQLLNTRSSLSTLRIPLSAYNVVCAGAQRVDLSNVVQVRFDFTESATGELAFDDLAFTD